MSAVDVVDGSSTRHVSAMHAGADPGSHNWEELTGHIWSMTIGLDIAKSVFQIHGIDVGVAKWSFAGS